MGSTSGGCSALWMGLSQNRRSIACLWGYQRIWDLSWMWKSPHCPCTSCRMGKYCSLHCCLRIFLLWVWLCPFELRCWVLQSAAAHYIKNHIMDEGSLDLSKIFVKQSSFFTLTENLKYWVPCRNYLKLSFFLEWLKVYWLMMYWWAMYLSCTLYLHGDAIRGYSLCILKTLVMSASKFI